MLVFSFLSTDTTTWPLVTLPEYFRNLKSPGKYFCLSPCHMSGLSTFCAVSVVLFCSGAAALRTTKRESVTMNFAVFALLRVNKVSALSLHLLQARLLKSNSWPAPANSYKSSLSLLLRCVIFGLKPIFTEKTYLHHATEIPSHDCRIR